MMVLEVGDQVRVRARGRSHTYDVGDVVTLDRLYDDGAHLFVNASGVKCWLLPDHYEPVAAVPPEVKGETVDRLLRLFAQLTHRIHAYEQDNGRDAATEDRAKRDIVKREILRRCGEVAQ